MKVMTTGSEFIICSSCKKKLRTLDYISEEYSTIINCPCGYKNYLG